jgi:CheY-like chemotaxis protein
MIGQVHVLLVEDNAADADLTREIFASSRFEIKLSVAVDGVAAINFLNGLASGPSRGIPRSFCSISICPGRMAARCLP